MKKSSPILLLALGAGLVIAGVVLTHLPGPVATLARVESMAAEDPHILFTGDVMLDRTIATHAARVGDDALFAGVSELFASEDAVVINLEGTITSSSSVSILDHSILRFTFDPHFAKYLSSIGVTAVSLSNNHTDDYGAEGLAETKNYLADAGIADFGSPTNTDDLSNELEVKGKRVCLVGYEEFVNPGVAPIIAELIRLRPSCDFLVATMHAGVEYQASSTAHQQEVAHAFIESGADAVIGTHPHVVEPLEIYLGRPIFYSLGNFLFDQDFSLATIRGLAVEVVWGSAATTYRLVPITTRSQEASVSDDTLAAVTLEDLITPELPSEIAASIRTTHSFALSNLPLAD